MKTLTVITTTYNRAQCIHQVYESLCRQNCRDFKWLVIDDGSTDETERLIKRWIKDGIIDIEYYYKQNGGMHTARNVAYELVNTELNVMIDSDDWMTDNGVQLIIDYWNKNRSEDLYGIIAYNISTEGKIIGSAFPDSIEKCTLLQLEDNYHVKGDKKIVLRSDLSKLYPYPEYPGEKFYPPSYKFKMLDQTYRLGILRDPVGVVDYNEDSMTYRKFNQYKTCCNGFAHFRNEMMRVTKSKITNIRLCIHYITESMLAKKKGYISSCSRPWLAVCCFPAGVLFFYYLMHTRKNY